MALIKCKECGTEVSSKAETCPKCGVRVTVKNGCLTFIVVIFLGFVTLAVLINTSKTHTTSGSYSSSASKNSMQAKSEQDCINEMFFKAAPGVTDRYEMRQEIYTYCKYAAANGVK